MKTISLLTLALLLASCAAKPSIELIEAKGIVDITWSEEEMAKDIAVRMLDRTENVSTHVIRLQGSESPHFHDKHDLSVTFISGDGAIHFQDRTVYLTPGDIIFIPKGTYHWAENRGEGPSLVYAIFSPPFDGKDRRRAE